MNENEKKQTIEFVKDKIKKIDINFEIKEKEKKISENNSVDSKYMNIKNISNNNNSLEYQYQKEYESYMNQDIFSQNIDTISFWSTRIDIFPLFSYVALSTLIIQSSSTASERRFSTIGRLVDKRYRLHPSTVSTLLTLKDYAD